ncbi:hypothetical protein [Lysinibacillus sp. fls2-241-R2A-57]|nr:hypothetical protein [Lysinibacillus sp. fls2-241-R2A-57]
MLAQAALRTPPGSFALCENVATATTNVLSARKQSGSDKAPVGKEINHT